MTHYKTDPFFRADSEKYTSYGEKLELKTDTYFAPGILGLKE